MMHVKLKRLESVLGSNIKVYLLGSFEKTD